jgi:hypothetical protein
MDFWKILRRTSLLVFVAILLLAWWRSAPSSNAEQSSPGAPRAMPKIP